MKSDKGDNLSASPPGEDSVVPPKGKAVLKTRIGDSIDLLVDYLADNHVKDIHPLIMGEIERRLIIKALQRSRGNKLQAAKLLGISRNTFRRKIQEIRDLGGPISDKPES